MDENKSRYILANFETALGHGYIMPYYQPVIRTISGQLCSFEALARWIDPTLGPLRPDEFIPVLEEHKLIHLLDSQIIHMNNPPEGMTSRDIRFMSEDDLLDMDYFLNDDNLDDDSEEEGFPLL